MVFIFRRSTGQHKPHYPSLPDPGERGCYIRVEVVVRSYLNVRRCKVSVHNQFPFLNCGSIFYVLSGSVISHV